MKASRELISDLARKSLNGDHTAFSFLMEVLSDINHPSLSQINRRASGLMVIDMVLIPLAKLVEGYPKPQVFTQSLVWNSANGRPHNENFPAEIWFADKYVAYFKGGERHRTGGKPAVIDVANKTIGFYENGEPRRHSAGPFKVELLGGTVALTYIMDDRMTTKHGHTPVAPSDSIDSRGRERYDVDDVEGNFEEPVEGGAHVIVTKNFIDVEGLGKSTPTKEDLKNLHFWRKELVNWLDWGSKYVDDYLNKFK